MVQRLHRLRQGARALLKRLTVCCCEAEQDAASKGVVGIRDYEMAENIDTWINRFAAGINGLRVDAGVYPERLRARH